jgi:hypothetical protein
MESLLSTGCRSLRLRDNTFAFGRTSSAETFGDAAAASTQQSHRRAILHSNANLAFAALR